MHRVRYYLQCQGSLGILEQIPKGLTSYWAAPGKDALKKVLPGLWPPIRSCSLEGLRDVVFESPKSRGPCFWAAQFLVNLWASLLPEASTESRVVPPHLPSTRTLLTSPYGARVYMFLLLSQNRQLHTPVDLSWLSSWLHRHTQTHTHTYYRTSQTARQFIYHKLISVNAEGLDLIHPTVPSSVASPRMCLMLSNCWLKAGTVPECKPMPLVSKRCPSTLKPFVWILHIYFLIWEVWMFKLLPPLSGVGGLF